MDRLISRFFNRNVAELTPADENVFVPRVASTVRPFADNEKRPTFNEVFQNVNKQLTQGYEGKKGV